MILKSNYYGINLCIPTHLITQLQVTQTVLIIFYLYDTFFSLLEMNIKIQEKYQLNNLAFLLFLLFY